MPARQDLWTGRLNFLWRGLSPLEYDQNGMVTLLSCEAKTTMLITDHHHLWQHGSGNHPQYRNAHSGHAAPRLICDPQDVRVDISKPFDELYNILNRACSKRGQG